MKLYVNIKTNYLKMEKTFNVSTVHDTAGRKMIQTIEPFTIIVDWDLDTVKIIKDDVKVSAIDMSDGFTLAEYEKLLVEIEKAANMLNNF